MKNIYLTKAQELNLKYAGLDLGDETEKKLEIIMEDNHTKKEAVDYLCNGSVVYEKEEFVKFFDQYMNEWDVEEEDREEMKKNILAEMREKYKNCNVQDVDVLEQMPFDHDGHHATGYEVKIDGFWDYDYEE